ncbi:MAG: radical SAM/SPASM domain-containing protein [Acidobacteria bacterium]|jgi:sulfatase maturation enzyme AslB (radical SAM superfamily)|nr:radical SAM/SPASM domain-containing protein [Acidobacteriota bacterium]
MILHYTLNNFNCRIPCPLNPGFQGFYTLKIRLLEKITPLYLPDANRSAICSWEFNTISSPLEEITINLQQLGVHAARAKTKKSLHAAEKYQMVKQPVIPGHLFIEITVSPLPASSHNPSVTWAELIIPAADLKIIQHNLRLAQTPPVQWFFMELTNCCNFRCRWCTTGMMTRPKGYMALDKAERLLEKIADYRRRFPVFSLYSQVKNPVFLHVMGEPLLHPQFFDIIRCGHRHGLDFCLVTNGSLLVESTIDKILDCGLQSLVISLNAPGETSFRQTCGSISYSLLVNQVRQLITKRYQRGCSLPRIELQLLNTKAIAPDLFSAVNDPGQLEQSLLLWSEFIMEQERLWHVRPHTANSIEGGGEELNLINALDEKNITPGKYFPLGQNIDLVSKEACNFGNALVPGGWTVQPALYGKCPFRNAHRIMCIFWDGECSFCTLDYNNSVNLGNVFNNSIEAIWEGEKMHRIRGLMDNSILIEPLCRQCRGTMIPVGK